MANNNNSNNPFKNTLNESKNFRNQNTSINQIEVYEN